MRPSVFLNNEHQWAVLSAAINNNERDNCDSWENEKQLNKSRIYKCQVVKIEAVRLMFAVINYKQRNAPVNEISEFASAVSSFRCCLLFLMRRSCLGFTMRRLLFYWWHVNFSIESTNRITIRYQTKLPRLVLWNLSSTGRFLYNRITWMSILMAHKNLIRLCCRARDLWMSNGKST